MIGEEEWGSHKAMEEAAAEAVAKWVEQIYAQEVVTTRAGSVSGKSSAEGGMPILECRIKWQEREGVWIRDDVLLAIPIDDEGIEHCSRVRREVDKVRARVQERCMMNVWVQVRQGYSRRVL